MGKTTGKTGAHSVKKKKITTRKGVMLVSLLAILIVVVSIITASYSWFLPTSTKSTGISYNSSAGFRSESCTVKHYAGTKNATTGVISYSKTEIATNTQSITRGTKAYYRTEITNTSSDYTTVFSLFFSNFPNQTDPTINAFGNVSLGISYPSNTFRTLSEVQTDYPLLRNVYLNANDGTNEDASISVEWFVVADDSSDFSFDINNIYLVYS